MTTSLFDCSQYEMSNSHWFVCICVYTIFLLTTDSPDQFAPTTNMYNILGAGFCIFVPKFFRLVRYLSEQNYVWKMILFIGIFFRK